MHMRISYSLPVWQSLYNRKLRTSLSDLLLLSRQRKMWNICCNARPQTSLLQTYGLLTVMTLILWITGYVECCSNVFIGNLFKNWTPINWSSFWLKRGLASSKMSLIRQLMNGEFTLMLKAKGKHFENMLWCAVPKMSIICFETYVQLFFVSQLLTSHDFYSFSSGCWTIFGTFIEFRTVSKYLISKCEIFTPFCYKYIQVTACKKLAY